jgi:outer membrane protein assembly factor BamB
MAEAIGERAPRKWTWRRARFAVVVAAIALAIVLFMALAPTDRLDRGMRHVYSAIAVVVAAALLLIWFVCFSPARRTVRLSALVAVLAILGSAAGAVRRVEFSGDMRPIIEWRWHADRNDVLEAHRASRAQQAAGPIDKVYPQANDVLEYRGARRDGVSEGPPLLAEWDGQRPAVVWRQPVGGGYAAFISAGPLLITIEQRRDKEAVVAYEAQSGREVWIHPHPALFSEKLGGDGPRATPSVHDDRVYSLGATGILCCLDLTTGREHWSKNILAENASAIQQWGMSGSPLVHKGLVWVTPGAQGGGKTSRAVLAFHADTGELALSGGSARGSYASPMLAVLAGQEQILVFDAEGLAAYDPSSAAELWRTSWKSDFDINAVQPVLFSEHHVLISSNAGCALFEISQSQGRFSVREKWRNRNMKCNYACPIAHGEFVYGLDEGILVCLDLETGNRQWKGGRYGHGQMLRRDDLLVILTESGELALVKATPEKHKELGRMQAIEGRTWNNPMLRGGRIFIRNHLEMAAYDLPLVPGPNPSDASLAPHARGSRTVNVVPWFTSL